MENPAHESAIWNTQGKLEYVMVLASINWSLQLQEVFRLGEVDVRYGGAPSSSSDDGLLGVIVVGGYHEGRLRGINNHGEEDGLPSCQLHGTRGTVDDRSLDHL